MVSGHDNVDNFEATISGIWNNSAVLNSAASVYQSSQLPHEQNTTAALSSSSTESPLRTISQGTATGPLDVSGGVSASPVPSQSIAINISAQSLPRDNTTNSSGGKQKITKFYCSSHGGGGYKRGFLI